MKKIFAIVTAVSLTACLVAQAPQKMSYQAVIRDNSGQLVANQPVGMRISILKGSPTGSQVYLEIYNPNPQTNSNGLITLEIGGGIPVSGNFSAIDWSSDTYFLKTETDPSGGTNYTITGTSQLLSVPYALYSKSAGSALDAVKLTGDQIVTGNKIFTGTTTVTSPVNSTDAATKAYVDAIMSRLSATGAIVADADGNIYSTVRIGSQVWMAENLKTTKYCNGDQIGTTTPALLDITGEASPKYQWAYNGIESNAATYGRLYTWYAVTDSRNVCPTGWHLPSHSEWTTLENFLVANGFNYDGTTTGNKYAKALASISGWTGSSAAGAVGNSDYPVKRNTTGFTALPGGGRSFSSFGSIGDYCTWWSATEFDASLAWGRTIYYYLGSVSMFGSNKKLGSYVRCVRD